MLSLACGTVSTAPSQPHASHNNCTSTCITGFSALVVAACLLFNFFCVSCCSVVMEHMDLLMHDPAPVVPLQLSTCVQHLRMQALHAQALSWHVVSSRQPLQHWCVALHQLLHCAAIGRLLLYLCPFCTGLRPASSNRHDCYPFCCPCMLAGC